VASADRGQARRRDVPQRPEPLGRHRRTDHDDRRLGRQHASELPGGAAAVTYHAFHVLNAYSLGYTLQESSFGFDLEQVEQVAARFPRDFRPTSTPIWPSTPSSTPSSASTASSASISYSTA
jgi:hypothetical protein